MILSIIVLVLLYFGLFHLGVTRRGLIEEYIKELKQTEPTKKVGLQVLAWYKEVLSENQEGHYSAYLTPQEFGIVKDFLYECGIEKMPAPEFRRRKGEFSKILSKTALSIFGLIKTAFFVFVLFKFGERFLLAQPSAIGLAKMWAFIIGVPILCALIIKGIKIVQAADE